MRSLAFLFLLSGISYSSIGQQCLVANLKENIAYLGLPTPLGIVVEHYACEDLLVLTDNGDLRATDNACSYDYMPEKEGKALIRVLDKLSRKELGYMPLRIKPLPTPTPSVAGCRGGVIPKHRLKVSPGVIGGLPGMDLDIKIRVLGFWVAVFRQDECLFFGRSTSAFFGDTISTFFASLHAGDMVVIGSIRYQMPGGQEGEMPAMTFTLSE